MSGLGSGLYSHRVICCLCFSKSEHLPWVQDFECWNQESQTNQDSWSLYEWPEALIPWSFLTNHSLFVAGILSNFLSHFRFSECFNLWRLIFESGFLISASWHHDFWFIIWVEAFHLFASFHHGQRPLSGLPFSPPWDLITCSCWWHQVSLALHVNFNNCWLLSTSVLPSFWYILEVPRPQIQTLIRVSFYHLFSSLLTVLKNIIFWLVEVKYISYPPCDIWTECPDLSY